MSFKSTEKRYQLDDQTGLGKTFPSDYEFISSSGTYRKFKTDKEGKIIRRLNNNNILAAVYEDKPITAEYVAELFGHPNMYLADTEPTIGRSLKVMETIGEDVIFRGFVAHKDISVRLTTEEHAENIYLLFEKFLIKETS